MTSLALSPTTTKKLRFFSYGEECYHCCNEMYRRVHLIPVSSCESELVFASPYIDISFQRSYVQVEVNLCTLLFEAFPLLRGVDGKRANHPSNWMIDEHDLTQWEYPLDHHVCEFGRRTYGIISTAKRRLGKNFLVHGIFPLAARAAGDLTPSSSTHVALTANFVLPSFPSFRIEWRNKLYRDKIQYHPLHPSY